VTILKPESSDHAIADLEPRGRNLPALVEPLRQWVPCSARYLAVYRKVGVLVFAVLPTGSWDYAYLSEQCAVTERP
jgi:hypothetical protein